MMYVMYFSDENVFIKVCEKLQEFCNFNKSIKVSFIIKKEQKLYGGKNEIGY